MSVTIAEITFDRVEYDAEADVPYLHVGDPSHAVEFDETLEATRVRLDGEATSSVSPLFARSGCLSARRFPCRPSSSPPRLNRACAGCGG